MRESVLCLRVRDAHARVPVRACVLVSSSVCVRVGPRLRWRIAACARACVLFCSFVCERVRLRTCAVHASLVACAASVLVCVRVDGLFGTCTRRCAWAHVCARVLVRVHMRACGVRGRVHQLLRVLLLPVADSREASRRRGA